MTETIVYPVASNLLSKLGECLFAPIGRQFEYVLCYKSYVEELKNGVKELENARQRVQSSVDEAVYDGKLIHVDVKNWLKSVNEETEKADNLLKRNESAKDACFRGWLPNPMVRHPIGRKVKKMAQVIQGLHKESQNNIFRKVYCANTPIGIVTAATSTARSAQRKEDVLVSRASVIEDVIKAITDDKVCVIGVHGPGGVGKSKLMEDVERRVKEEQLFDVVATTNVSRNPDLKRIQAEIAYALGLTLVNEETAYGRADLLCKRLEKDSEKKILIILDNLWTKLELKEVGIPCGYNNKVRGCKLLLTSRDRHVLYTEMGSDREFQLSELEHEEACTLFERTVGDRVNDLEFKIFVNRVVENCGGLPLLIISVANRLKRGDLLEWRDASTNKEGSDVKSIVEFSYNNLKDERIKALFLVHALFSQGLGTRDALIYCMGLGLYKKFSKTIEDARDKLIMDRRRLLDSSLLLGNYGRDRLSMHDLFIDVAISMHDKFIDTEWNALVGREDFGFNEWSKYDIRKCTAMSFLNVGIDEIPEKLDCPNMRIFLLIEQNRSLKVPESFFESMQKLQVLDLTGLSFTSLPSSMEFLENLTSLSLDDCHLEDVTALGKLKGLQFLSFFRSEITRLPKEIGELVELRLLNLSRCVMLKVIEPGVLKSLVNLEVLNMSYSFNWWEAEDETPRSNASLAEFKNMKKLTTLYIGIPHSANLPRDLPFGKLNKHEILIGDCWGWQFEDESRTLKLKLDSGNLLLEQWVQRCLQRAQDLHLVGLRDNHNIHDLCFQDFQELKHLHVQNSPSLQYIVHSTEDIQCTAFVRLESLFLNNLNNMEKTFHGRLAPESFSKLKIVKLDNCGEIKYLFPSSMMRIFLPLEDIEISRCHSIKQIVVDAEVDEDGDEIDVDPEVKSYNLRWLTLRNLPKMTNFYKIIDHSVVLFDRQQLIKLQSLEAMTVEKCHLIREVFDLEELTTSGDVEILCRLTRLTLSGLPSLERIWNKNPRKALCFRNLEALKVQNCENLRFLFSSSMAKALVQIKEIEIASCVLMEEIMYVQEEELAEATTTDTLEFPLLTSLSLVELSNLKTFSYGKYCIHCPSLTRLTISKCPKMMIFSSFKGRQQLMTSDRGLQQAFGRINSSLSLPSFFNEKVHFPSLEELKLSSMCQLKRIWHNQLHEQSFCKLASLTIELCENLSHVFPSNSMDMLPSLSKIKAIGCPSLEALFEPISHSFEKRQKPLVFPALREMTLLNLSGLRDILKSDCEVTLAFPSLMEVNVRGCHSLTYLFSSATVEALDKLAMLDVSCCNNLRGIIVMGEGKGKTLETLKFHQLSTLKLGDLENLISFRLVSCASDGLHPLFDEKVKFPNIESMEISHMNNLENIWLDDLASNAFSKLKTLVVKYCEKLSFIFSSYTMLTRFQNLEKISITDCGSLEVVFHVQELDFSEACPTRTFELRELVLTRLPKMKHVWSGHPQGGLTFGHLRCMEIVECERLKSLFPSSVAKSMTQLEELLVRECGVQEIIVEEDKVEMNARDLFFPRLTDMKLLELPDLRSFYRNSHTSTWPLLKKLQVRHCSKMRSFSFACEFQSCQGTSTIENQLALFSFEKVIPNLKRLTLMSEDVTMMTQQHHYVFRDLIELDLACYHDENVGFPSDFLLHRFPDLEVLSLSYSSLEEIFPEDVCGHGGATSYGELTDMETPLKALKNLQQLELNKLCKLQRVWKDGSLMAEILKQIETLLISECSSLSIVLPSPIAFQRLTELEVKDCAGLVHMGTCSVMTSLVHLTWLTLRNCGAMEDVVTDDGNGIEEISFPKLRRLILDGLPSLKSFSTVNCTFMFPLLWYIIVKQCPKMNIFCNGALSTPGLHEVRLSDEDYEGRWEGDLNTTIQFLST
ncbi:hypothetical protein ACJRO7_011272 [Eucalyptus globulus]|uniref:NB-ARC domain-containing protein n=1 Tax=Eucalyptus globulus TaxID=34317 RepID=A0ABD3LJ78_EUCGL